jgi:hypothetical protein
VIGLVSALVGKIAGWLFGASIEAAGERSGVRWFRSVCLVLAILISSYIAVASALFWEVDSQPGVMGLWQFTQQSGGPLWTLTLPVLAAILTLWLLLPLPGRHGIGVALTAGVFGLSLAAIIAMTGSGVHSISTATLISMLSALLLPILALVLAISDVPPLDAAMAHVSWVYWGRLRHLRALRLYGARHLWHVIEPHGTDSSLTVKGVYDAGRRVAAKSVAQFRLSTENSANYFLQADMSSPRDIIPFRISFTKPEKEVAERAYAGEARARGQRTIYYFLLPDPRTPMPASFAPRIARVIDEGRSFLRNRDFVVATPYGIRYTHYSGAFQFSPKEANLDPYPTWIRSLLALLEEVTPLETATPLAE